MEELRKRLEKLAAQKSAEEKMRAEDALRWQESHLPYVYTFDNVDEMREEFDLIRNNFIRMDQCWGMDDECPLGVADDDFFWKRFAELLQARQTIVYGEYQVKDVIDESSDDEKNLLCEARHLHCDPKMVIHSYPESLMRMLISVAKFAKNIGSPFYPRVLELMVTARYRGKFNSHLSAEDAQEYAADLRKYIELLLAERFLLSEDELKEKLADPGPKDSDIEDEENAAFALFDDYDEPEDATEASRQKIVQLYRKQVRVLLEPTMRKGENLPPIQILARETKKLLADMERGEPAEPNDDYPYAMLEDLLKVNTQPIYLKYRLNPSYGDESLPWQPKCEGDPFVVTMPEHEQKMAILKDFEDFLRGGMYIAHRIESRSLEDWQKAVMFLRQVGEELCRARPTRRSEAETVIHQFFASIRNARAQLWIDLQTRGGKYDFAAESATSEPATVRIDSCSIDEAAKKIGREIKPKGGRPVDPDSRWTYKEIVCRFGLKDEDAVTRWNRGDGAPEGWKEEFVFRRNDKALNACARTYLESHGKFDAMKVSGMVHGVIEQVAKTEDLPYDEQPRRKR